MRLNLEAILNWYNSITGSHNKIRKKVLAILVASHRPARSVV